MLSGGYGCCSFECVRTRAWPKPPKKPTPRRARLWLGVRPSSSGDVVRIIEPEFMVTLTGRGLVSAAKMMSLRSPPVDEADRMAGMPLGRAPIPGTVLASCCALANATYRARMVRMLLLQGILAGQREGFGPLTAGGGPSSRTTPKTIFNSLASTVPGAKANGCELWFFWDGPAFDEVWP